MEKSADKTLGQNKQRRGKRHPGFALEVYGREVTVNIQLSEVCPALCGTGEAVLHSSGPAGGSGVWNRRCRGSWAKERFSGVKSW